MNPDSKKLIFKEYVRRPKPIEAIRCTLKNHLDLFRYLVSCGYTTTILLSGGEPYIEVVGVGDIDIGDYVIIDGPFIMIVNSEDFKNEYEEVGK